MAIHIPVETTPENINAIAVELQRCAAELQGVAAAITDSRFEKLRVVNFGLLQAAVKGSNSYLKAARDALWEARKERGDFGAIPTTSRPKKRGRPKKGE